MAKSTKAEKEYRVGEVETLLLSGATQRAIWRHVTESEKGPKWPISMRTLERYISEARANIRAHANFDRAEEIGKARGRLEMLLARNLAVSDYKTALAVVKEMNSLCGLHAPTEIKQTGITTIVVKHVRKEVPADDGGDTDSGVAPGTKEDPR